MYKTDLKLGLQVRDELIKFGVETPMTTHNSMDYDAKNRAITDAFTGIMQNLGLDLNDDSLKDTPKRVAKMYLDEIFCGLDYSKFPKCTTVDNKFNYDEMVVVDGISSISFCEHHFATIDGLATVAYLPKSKVLGLSKINRVVKFFSQRPQIQERLTEQIYHALSYILETENVAVKIVATHYCVKSRGIEDTGSNTTTTKLGGQFKEPATRAEFLNYKK